MCIRDSGGTAHLGTGEVLENAAIGFADGFIDYVGAARDVDPKRYARVVDAEGKHIYPGFIAPNSTLGLMEIAAVRASRDYAEVGRATKDEDALRLRGARRKVGLGQHGDREGEEGEEERRFHGRGIHSQHGVHRFSSVMVSQW